MDENGNKVGGNDAVRYILSKSNFDILEKYWKLVELNGKQVRPIAPPEGSAHHLQGSRQQSQRQWRMQYHFRAYKIEGLNRISFSKMISTKMACPRMDVEAEFLSILENMITSVSMATL